MRIPKISLALLAIFAGAVSSVAAQGDNTDHWQTAVATYRTGIHSRPDGESRTICSVPKDMRLAVGVGDDGAWRRVLLTNGSYGYILGDALQVYPAEYVAKRSSSPRAGMPLSSRGGSRNRNAGYDTRESIAANNASNFLGIPYKWGGNDESGIDCSGLVKKLYGEVGVSLPRTAAEQALVGTPITRLENLMPGDRLYFWESKRGIIGHTGIYVGGGYFIHASSGHGQVAKEPLGQPKWLHILVAARRS